MFSTCTQSVTILYAIFFGTGDACLRIDLWSILSAFAAFMVLVVIAQFIARKVWAHLTNPDAALTDRHPRDVEHPINDDPNYRNSAIRSSKR